MMFRIVQQAVEMLTKYSATLTRTILYIIFYLII